MSYSHKVNHEGLLILEQPLLRVPLENLQKTFRASRKAIEKEYQYLSNQITDMTQSLQQPAKDGDVPPPKDLLTLLDTAIQRFTRLKQTLEASQREEDGLLKKCKKRVDHLATMLTVEDMETDAMMAWTQTRLYRQLVDCMMRHGHIETAKAIAAGEGLEDMTDADLFQAAQRIEEALNRRSCTECLQWCSDNRSTLRKLKSTLELDLRLQEFIELVRVGKQQDAILYAKKHLMAFADQHSAVIQRVMALLAFAPNTSCKPYQALYHLDRWEKLKAAYREAHLALHALPPTPLLLLSLSAGLPALKTRACMATEEKTEEGMMIMDGPMAESEDEDGLVAEKKRRSRDKEKANSQVNVNCPVCFEPLKEVAEKLPYSHRLNSCIVDRIDHCILDEANPVMVLPNGNAYGQKSLQALAKANHGHIIDPRTGEVFRLDSLKKAFVL